MKVKLKDTELYTDSDAFKVGMIALWKGTPVMKIQPLTEYMKEYILDLETGNFIECPRMAQLDRLVDGEFVEV